MSHIPHGYRIENGKAAIDDKAAEQIRQLFSEYLSGASLITAAERAGLTARQTSAKRILTNRRYLGDAYYPAIINEKTFKRAEEELEKRARKLGRLYERKAKEVHIPTGFNMKMPESRFDDPFEQAEYEYSLITEKGR